jgi:WD40 repeat protein
LRLENNDLVSFTGDKVVNIWNSTNGQLKSRFRVFKHNRNNPLLILSDGRLVTAASDFRIKLRNKHDYSLIRNFEISHKGYITSLVLLKNGDLASGSEDSTIKIWELNTGKVKQTLSGHESGVYCLAVLKDNFLASGSADNTIRIWNINEGCSTSTLKGHTGAINSLLVQNNEYLVSGSADRTMKIWDKENLKRTINVSFPIEILKKGENDTVFASGLNSIELWNVQNNKLIEKRKFSYNISSVVVLKNDYVAISDGIKVHIGNILQ